MPSPLLAVALLAALDGPPSAPPSSPPSQLPQLILSSAERALDTVKAVPAGVKAVLVLDEAVRGRDQRALPIRALALVHPYVRVALTVVAFAVACAL